MDWQKWNILIFGIIPILAVTVIFIGRRKLLWTAPLVSAALSFIAYIIALSPITISEIFSDNEWRAFFILAMLMHLGIVAVLTILAYIVAYMLKRKSVQTE